MVESLPRENVYINLIYDLQNEIFRLNTMKLCVTYFMIFFFNSSIDTRQP